MKSRDHTAYIPDGRWYQCRMQFIYDSIRDFMRCALEHTHTNLYHRQYFALDPDWKRAVPSHSPQSTIHITNNSSRIKFAFSYQQFQAYCIHSELAVFSIAISLYLLKMRHVKRLWINLQTFMHKKCFFFFVSNSSFCLCKWRCTIQLHAVFCLLQFHRLTRCGTT